MRITTLTTIGLASIALAGSAMAGTFDVKGADVDKGQTEVSVPGAVQSGFPENAERVQSSWEVGISYGFTERFKLGVKANFDRPLPDLDEEEPPRHRLRASTVGVEGQYVLLKPRAGMPALSWFTGIDAAVHKDETNAVTFGPLIGFGDDKLSMTLNPLFERTFGRNHEPGVSFVYAWQVKKEIVDHVALALEGFGAIPDIGNAPGVEFQEHRIGPVLILDGDLFGANGNGKAMKLGGADGKSDASGPKAELQFGVLRGLTEATPDWTGKLKLSINW